MIREAIRSDLNDLLNLYNHLHETDSPYPDRKLIESTWIEILTDKKIYCFVNVVNKKIVSSCING
ncbi:hypothetical protein MHK_006525, partial [Candidatus Magnetomorum sp. HK-1]